MTSNLRRTLGAAALAVLIVLVAAACGDDSSTSSTTGAATPTAANAWARASAASQSDGAAYLDITGGKAADSLTGVSVPADIATKVEMHETAMSMGSGSGSGATGGMMEMKPVTSIAIPAGKKVSLSPGGYHLMLVGLAKPLTTGQTFTMTLTFAKAGKVDVPVEVRS